MKSFCSAFETDFAWFIPSSLNDVVVGNRASYLGGKKLKKKDNNKKTKQNKTEKDKKSYHLA